MTETQTTPSLPSGYMHASEVIRLLRLDISPTTGKQDTKAAAMRRLKYLRTSGALPYHRLTPQIFLYRRSDINRFMASNRVEVRHG